jgi:hypothetical protein
LLILYLIMFCILIFLIFFFYFTTLFIWISISKISRFSKLLLYIFFRITSSNINFSFLFRLLYSLFCINRWELNVFIFRIESKKRHSPISFFFIPFRSLMELIQFIFRKQNAHNLITKFNSFFLASYYIKKLAFLLLMFMS